MQAEYIQYLLERHLAGQLTASEQEALDEIMQNSDYEGVVQGALLRLIGEGGEVKGGEGGGAEILQNIFSIDKTADHSTIDPTAGESILSRSLFFYIRRLSVAAAIIVAVAGIFFFFHQPKPTPVSKVVRKPANITPGSNRAVLTLANGQQIILDDAHNGVLGEQGKTRVIKLDSGRLAYAMDKRENNVAPVYNIITTPRGGQYQITLPDATKVWLNAESSLRFPTAFTEKDRSVQLTGEAYFEVAPNKNQPFLVKAGQTETRVLGTQFNIMAYGDEGQVKTTLLEGSVRVGQGAQDALLSPGEQGQFDPAKGRMITRVVNTRQVTAWKDGYYYFDRSSVESVMRQIARWYDVDIVYQGAAPRDEIVGKIPRTAHVTEVLHIMELIGIRFRIEGRTITVLT